MTILEKIKNYFNKKEIKQSEPIKEKVVLFKAKINQKVETNSVSVWPEGGRKYGNNTILMF